jgi:hypothetical protein
MYINSASEGLQNPSFKSLVYAQKIWFPAVAGSAVQIWNLNKWANSKQNIKKLVK